ncbi:MAG: GTPase HflX [Magnetococcales bacterium]|nr:GTPase HflX [Magnetococcales bacterium]MBF0323008.1 GTPase HflX [Magnetococcales bacterium]
MHTTQAPRERALLIQMVDEDPDRAERLAEELRRLVVSAGLEPVGARMVALARIVPATFLGKGRLEVLAGEIQEHDVRVVVFNNALSPVQQRNLERALVAKVVDRTGLILEIFAARARTREGCLQVELAALLYEQSRLVRSWTHLERQRGGVGMRGGPGETQIELDRRQIRVRIQRLKKSLCDVERTRTLQRRERQDVPLFVTALVGYTNAGKSTLFNRLATAHVDAEDKLFATLDPTMRGITLPDGGRAILCDTVGFIRDLPHQLVAAFRATLEEVVSADLLLHVVDISDPEWGDQAQAVLAVLTELGVQHKPMLTVYNKADMLPEGSGQVSRLEEREESLVISARTGLGLDLLLARLATARTQTWQEYRLTLPACDGALLARLCREGRILTRQEMGDEIEVTLALPVAGRGRLRDVLARYATT